MVWQRRGVFNEFSDSKIVRSDYIVVEGTTLGYSFLDAKNTPFERGIWAPIFYLFKIHRNHPMRIYSSSPNYVHIWPAGENKRKGKNFRMPAEVVRDKMDHDLSTFMLLPFDVETKFDKSLWMHFPLDESFVHSSLGVLADSSLIYCPHGISFHSQDGFSRVSEVMPSQVLTHFFSWLTQPHKITSHLRTFDQKQEGLITVPFDQARDLSYVVISLLEKRFNTRLMHDHYRNFWRDIEMGFRNKR